MTFNPVANFDHSAVLVSDLCKTIDHRQVLTDIRFDLLAGRTLGIAGVNGAGKTTLLRCILDFMKPSSGSIKIFGVPSTEPSARNALAYLPERFVPPGYLSGHETLVWLAGLRNQRWSREQSEAGFAQYRIDPKALRRPLREFSKGMTQKIGLMACLLSSCPLLILDEPMSGLDPLARRFVADALAQAKLEGRSIILTSHAMHDLDRLCDTLLVIHEGRMRFNGPPGELRAATACSTLDDAFVSLLQTEDTACHP
jgi:ABC-2 type transport system ATP-binding protein